MLRWLGKQPVRALGGFCFPLNEVQPGGCSLAAQHWPLAVPGPWRGHLGCEMGEQWLCKALCC